MPTNDALQQTTTFRVNEAYLCRWACFRPVPQIVVTPLVHFKLSLHPEHFPRTFLERRDIWPTRKSPRAHLPDLAGPRSTREGRFVLSSAEIEQKSWVLWIQEQVSQLDLCYACTSCFCYFCREPVCGKAVGRHRNAVRTVFPKGTKTKKIKNQRARRQYFFIKKWCVALLFFFSFFWDVHFCWAVSSSLSALACSSMLWSSPARWCCRIISQPPTNSPPINTCGIVGQSLRMEENKRCFVKQCEPLKSVR